MNFDNWLNNYYTTRKIAGVQSDGLDTGQSIIHMSIVDDGHILSQIGDISGKYHLRLDNGVYLSYTTTNDNDLLILEGTTAITPGMTLYIIVYNDGSSRNGGFYFTKDRTENARIIEELPTSGASLLSKVLTLDDIIDGKINLYAYNNLSTFVSAAIVSGSIECPLTIPAEFPAYTNYQLTDIKIDPDPINIAYKYKTRVSIDPILVGDFGPAYKFWNYTIEDTNNSGIFDIKDYNGYAFLNWNKPGDTNIKITGSFKDTIIEKNIQCVCNQHPAPIIRFLATVEDGKFVTSVGSLSDECANTEFKNASILKDAIISFDTNSPTPYSGEMTIYTIFYNQSNATPSSTYNRVWFKTAGNWGYGEQLGCTTDVEVASNSFKLAKYDIPEHFMVTSGFEGETAYTTSIKIPLSTHIAAIAIVQYDDGTFDQLTVPEKIITFEE